MPKLNLFNDLESKEIQKLITCFQGKKYNFKKGEIIFSFIENRKKIGIMLSGKSELIRYDLNGNKNLIDSLEENDIFSEIFYKICNNNEFTIIAKENVEVLFFDYENLITNCKKNCPYHLKIIDNFIKILSNKIIDMNDQILILSERSIRNKLLTYFSLLSSRTLSKKLLFLFL